METQNQNSQDEQADAININENRDSSPYGNNELGNDAANQEDYPETGAGTQSADLIDDEGEDSLSDSNEGTDAFDGDADRSGYPNGANPAETNS